MRPLSIKIKGFTAFADEVDLDFGDLDLFGQVQAVNETAAHLEVLLVRGQVSRETSPEGADLYQTAHGTT